MTDTATRPDFFASFQSLKTREKAKKAGVTEEEQAYYAMSQSIGWKHFETLKNELLSDMDRLLDMSVAQGQTREQIGENAIVMSLARGVITRLFNKVYDARDAVEKKKQ